MTVLRIANIKVQSTLAGSGHPQMQISSSVIQKINRRLTIEYYAWQTQLYIFRSRMLQALEEDRVRFVAIEENLNTESAINLYFLIFIGQQILAIVSNSFRLNHLLADYWRCLFHHQFSSWKHDGRLLERRSDGRTDSITRSVNQRHRRADSNWLEKRHKSSWRLDFELRCRWCLLLLVCVDKCVFLVFRRANLFARNILADVDHVRL